MNLSDYQQYFKVDPDGGLLVRTDFKERLKEFKGNKLSDLLTIVFFSQADVFSSDALEKFILATKEFGYEVTSTREMRRKFEAKRNILREQLKKSAGEKCTNCGTTHDLTIDHIVSLKSGGTNDFHNLQFLCRTCNAKKGTR